jgi:hypothetical protein
MLKSGIDLTTSFSTAVTDGFPSFCGYIAHIHVFQCMETLFQPCYVVVVGVKMISLGCTVVSLCSSFTGFCSNERNSGVVEFTAHMRSACPCEILRCSPWYFF